MASAFIGLFGLFFGGVMVNFTSAGLVAGLYFWRNVRSATRRAFQGAALTGLLFLLMFSVTFFIGLADGTFAPAQLLLFLPFIFALGFLTGLPGAFIMSRKIAKSDPLGDTFS